MGAWRAANWMGRLPLGKVTDGPNGYGKTERWKLRAGNPLNRTARSRSCSSGRKARGGGASRFCRGIKPRRNARPGAAAGHPGGRSGVLPERSPWRRRPSFSFRSPLFLLGPEFHGSGPVVRLAGGGAHPPWGAGHFLRVPGHSRRGFPHRFAGPGLCRHHLRVGTERSAAGPSGPHRGRAGGVSPRALPCGWSRAGSLLGTCWAGAVSLSEPRTGVFPPSRRFATFRGGPGPLGLHRWAGECVSPEGLSPAGGAGPFRDGPVSLSEARAGVLPPSGWDWDVQEVCGAAGPARGLAVGVFLPGVILCRWRLAGLFRDGPVLPSRTACRRFACLPVVQDVREPCGAVRPAQGGAGGVFPRGSPLAVTTSSP